MNLKTKKKISKLLILLSCALAFTLVFSIIAAQVSEIKASAAEQINYLLLYSDYESKQDAFDAAYELNQQIAEEGMVLLKNKDNVLPLSDAKYITVFGKSSADVIGAHASGFQGYSKKSILINDSLREAGFKVNPAMEAFYASSTRSPIDSYTVGTGAGKIVNETKLENYNKSLWDTCITYNDAAIVVLRRQVGEGGDASLFSAKQLPSLEANSPFYGGVNAWKDASGNAIAKLDQAVEINNHYLQLTTYEADLLVEVGERFDNVVVVMNATSSIQPDFLEDGADGLCDLSYYRTSASTGASKVNIKGVVWAGGPGLDGIRALGKILNGTVNPSGRTVDMWSKNFKNDPATLNWAYNGIQDGNRVNFGVTGGKPTYTSDYYKSAPEIDQLSYGEGIYVGYRYYETRAYVEAKAQTPNLDWYGDNVVYPFGYGLSYTSFDWTVKKSTQIADLKTHGDALGNGRIEVEVEVKNAGFASGKDVVQLYYSAPYIAGGVEKSHVVLGDFAKTKVLQPGESQTLKVGLRLHDMASYDMEETITGNTATYGTGGYILDKGDYFVGICADSHNLKDGGTTTAIRDGLVSDYVIKYTLSEKIKFDKDPDTQADVKNLFNDVTDGILLYGNNNNLASETNKLPWLSRADFDGTMPRVTKQESLTRSVVYMDEIYRTLKYATGTDAGTKATTINSAYDDDSTKGGAWIESEWYKARATTGYAAEDANGNRVIQRGKNKDKKIVEGTAETGEVSKILLYDLSAVDFHDEKWDDFMDQLTVNELCGFPTYGGFTLWGSDYLGVPKSRTPDGPEILCFDPGPVMNYAYQSLLAATYNTDLSYEMGRSFGNEAMWADTSAFSSQGDSIKGPIAGWYAPGCNMHRTQFGGRNYGYYSEDPTLASQMLFEECRGATDKGLITFMKHFALNDQETDRDTNSLITWANEQTMREIDFKAAEQAFKGPSLGTMTGFNRIGDVWTGESYALMTQLLRDEWDFQGAAVTDAFNNWMDIDRMTRAGQDVALAMNPFSTDVSHIATTPGAKVTVEKVDATGNVVRDANKVIQFEEVTMDFDTQVAALRNATKNILFAISRSTAMRNGACLEYCVNGTNDLGTAYTGKTASYSAKFNDVMSHSTITYSLYSGELPAGLSLNASTGAITGTVSSTAAAKTYTFTVKGLLDKWAPKLAQYSITVKGLSGSGGEVYAVSGEPTAIDASVTGADSITYSVSGTLPTGLSINTSTGEIAGTSTAPGKYTFNVVAEADGYSDVSTEYTIYVLGTDGGDGDTPTVEIGTDGYWYINGEKTNILAQGPQGSQGPQGVKGDTGAAADGGCNGTIAGTSIGIILALLGVALVVVFKRRKTEK